MNAHSYIISFARAVQEAGYEVVSFLPDEPQRSAIVTLRKPGSRRKAASGALEFRAWVENRLNARGEREDFGYVELTMCPRVGRSRLLDWTRLADRDRFRMDGNGARQELISVFREL